MYRNYWNSIKIWKQKKAQELPGWMFVVGLILGLVLVVFMIWLAMKSGSAAKESILGFR